MQRIKDRLKEYMYVISVKSYVLVNKLKPLYSDGFSQT